jgi:hypothetical protein
MLDKSVSSTAAAQSAFCSLTVTLPLLLLLLPLLLQLDARRMLLGGGRGLKQLLSAGDEVAASLRHALDSAVAAGSQTLGTRRMLPGGGRGKH